VTKFSEDGTSLVYSTFVGGTGITSLPSNYYGDQGNSIAVDGNGEAYITGYTDSTTFPTTTGAYQTTLKSTAQNAFLSKLSADGSTLLYSTFLGGTGSDTAYGVAVDADGSAYITGKTSSANFPVVTGAFESTRPGSYASGFVSKFAFGPQLTSLNPNNAPVSTPDLNMIVMGSYFTPQATVLWNGSPRSTTYVSSTELIASITNADLAAPGEATVVVATPAPLGTQSNTLIFTIGQPNVQLFGVGDLARNATTNVISLVAGFSNIGNAPATNVVLTGATLNGVKTTTKPLPSIGTLVPGQDVGVMLAFPGTAGTSGQTVFLKVSGSYSGGNYTSSMRVTLP
jgi:hypothetical protein